jgi:hypothetical protein
MLCIPEVFGGTVMNDFALFRDWLGYLYLIFVFLALLGVYLVFLGIGLAGLVSALRRQERIKSIRRTNLSAPPNEPI